MTQVKATQPHINAHGKPGLKATGTVYSVSERDAERLVGAGVVEIEGAKADAGKAKRVSGTRKSTRRGAAESNRPQRASAGGETGDGTAAGADGATSAV